MKKLIIDRFEGEYAVCEKEDKSFVNICRDKVPEVCKEGDIIVIDDGTVYSDEESTKEREKKIKELMGEVFTRE